MSLCRKPPVSSIENSPYKQLAHGRLACYLLFQTEEAKCLSEKQLNLSSKEILELGLDSRGSGYGRE